MQWLKSEKSDKVSIVMPTGRENFNISLDNRSFKC